jgi:DNA polymerase III subunit epsilon
MAAALLGQIQHDLHRCHGIAAADHALLVKLQRCAKPKVAAWMRQHAGMGAERVVAA